MDYYKLSGLGPNETIGVLPDYYFPPFITLAHMFSAPPNWAIRNREMKQYVLQYVVDGIADYPIEGNSYTTRRGDLLFHRPMERHSILPHSSQPYVCISIVFHFGLSPFPVHELYSDEHYLGNFADHPIDNMLSELVANYRQPGLDYQMRCQSLLMRILTDASLRSKEEAHAKNDASNKPQLVLVKNYLHSNYHRDVQLKELEELSGWSKNYLLLIFRKYMGMSPIQYLTWLRINKAKELAIHSNLTISEIAERVGYSDVHTFGRMFKKKTGHSLSQFCANLIHS
ncbi:AraC family transcriptional regulator [Paenibacillus glycanilyticus]|uniref:helix-turn-helix domain-containing protein n=1 Tax=Paenibacillus glycanilyticus TaxID=126569 RepID=UPI00203FE7AA|nr:AraC family transcriptional regulator [Paenibacillus glycanilyticus]MCM3626085.1 AraC family transcriptional regulator [Paenibacillus glycanilyticus]